MPKSSHTAKKKFPSLSPYHRLNATVRQPKYVKDAVTYLKACQKVNSKFPKEEQKKKWITQFPWDSDNPVARKWRLPFFISPLDENQLKLTLLWAQEKKSQGGALIPPMAVGLKGNRFLILEVDLSERHNDIMASLDGLITHYRKLFGFHSNRKNPRHKNTNLDPWAIWDQVHLDGKNLNAIAKERADCHKNPTYDTDVAKEYQSVRRAYKQAQEMMKQVEVNAALPEIPS